MNGSVAGANEPADGGQFKPKEDTMQRTFAGVVTGVVTLALSGLVQATEPLKVSSPAAEMQKKEEQLKGKVSTQEQRTREQQQKAAGTAQQEQERVKEKAKKKEEKAKAKAKKVEE